MQPWRKRGEFLCLSLSVKGKGGAISSSSAESSAESGGGREGKEAVGAAAAKLENGVRGRLKGRGAMNTTKHLCAGAVAAMVSRSGPLTLSCITFVFCNILLF